MSYELYTATHTRPRGSPIIAIRLVGGFGKISLNATGARILLKAKAKSLFLLWDRSASKIALRVAPEGAIDAYHLVFNRQGNQCDMSALGFLRHIGWSAPDAVRLVATWNEREKMFEATIPPEHLEAAKRSGLKVIHDKKA